MRVTQGMYIRNHASQTRVAKTRVVPLGVERKLRLVLTDTGGVSQARVALPGTECFPGVERVEID